MRRNPSTRAALAGLGTLALLGLTACGGSSDDDGPGPVACADLNGMTVAATDIGLPTTGARVTSTEVIPAAGTGATAVGEYCKVLGDIDPVDATAPAIKFQLNLPAQWNRKSMMFGGGGYNGTIATGAGNVPAGPTDQPTPLGQIGRAHV
jgi:feruloyl esterase